MTVIKRGTVKSYDADAHKATVQIAGSLGVWLDAVRVATDIPAADVVAGRQCSVLFLDPSNQDDAVIITIQGALPSGGGGATTFTGLTDTPNAYTGAGLQLPRVNSGQTALEFHDPYAAAHTWAALQTFNAGLKLAASQQVQDSGGSGRILLATTDPNITLTGSTRINSNVGIDSAPSLSPDAKLVISPTPAAVTDWRGIQIVPTLGFTGSNRVAYGVFGSANIRCPAGQSGHSAYGLKFTATYMPDGAASDASRIIGCQVSPAAYASGSTKSGTLAEFTAFDADFNPLTILLGASITFTSVYGLRIRGRGWSNITVPTLYGIRVEDQTGVSGNCYLLEVGPATPYLRLVGGSNPGAGLTNLYLNENGTLRRVQWKDGASIGAGDKVMVLV